MFKPFTVVAVGLSLALSGAALAKEKIDFMFPAPVLSIAIPSLPEKNAALICFEFSTPDGITLSL